MRSAKNAGGVSGLPLLRLRRLAHSALDSGYGDSENPRVARERGAKCTTGSATTSPARTDLSRSRVFQCGLAFRGVHRMQGGAGVSSLWIEVWLT